MPTRGAKDSRQMQSPLAARVRKGKEGTPSFASFTRFLNCPFPRILYEMPLASGATYGQPASTAPARGARGARPEVRTASRSRPRVFALPTWRQAPTLYGRSLQWAWLRAWCGCTEPS